MVRWESLFADLEAQWESEQDAVFEAEVADRTSIERVTVGLLDRVRGSDGRSLTLYLVEGEPVAGAVVEAGADWMLLRADREDVLVPLHAVAAVEGLGTAVSPGGPLAGRITLAVVLRGLAERRSPALVLLRGGTRLSGSIARVGADHVDLLTHPVDEPWNLGPDRVIPFTAMLRITCRD